MPEQQIMDGNEAAGRVAHRLSEVVAIYPITPASPMGELADTLSSRGTTNLWGDVPTVIEMQSEGGAAGALHGALQGGSLATTFTASQGLLLMLPNMYKVAGELTPGVIHVAARAIATHALSIFGDHGDVMAARGTGWAILHSASVQEAQDMAAVAHAVTLRSRVPILHAMDGFRTSHELAGVTPLTDAVLEALVPPSLVDEHRSRALRAADPVVRGTAQNPDVFFQSREAANPWHDSVPAVAEEVLAQFAELTGRNYGIVEYHGHPGATDVVVVSGSGVWAVRDAVDQLNSTGRRCGVVHLRLFRPFPADALTAALPGTVERIAVLDRCKEPGSAAEPLCADVTTAVAAAAGRGAFQAGMPTITGGRYGLGSKEFTPAMAAAVFDALGGGAPPRQFTVGINDDVTGLSLPVEVGQFPEREDVTTAVLVGLGSDGTVGAAKNACKIAAGRPGHEGHVQGYFVYDSKKSGAVTVSHLRFAEEPLEAPWLIDRTDYLGIHQFSLLERHDLLDRAAVDATVVINSPHGPEDTFDRLPADARRHILERNLSVHVVDAASISRKAGLGGIVSTVMLTCFVKLAGLAGGTSGDGTGAVKAAIEADYGKLGDAVLRPNFAAVDATLESIRPMPVPSGGDTGGDAAPGLVPVGAPEFVAEVTAEMMAGRGDSLPVSVFPPDGTYPPGTTRWEKRGIALEVPAWEPDLCIDCGRCAAICPHAAVRTKAYEPGLLDDAPDAMQSKDAKFLEGHKLTVQVFPDDCTGCGLCVEICPARSRSELKTKALNLVERAEVLEDQRSSSEFFTTLPDTPPEAADPLTTRGVQLREPLFEFSGACSGCGETPYLKLLTQVAGDHMVVANATGCSSIYGANLPTTPWKANHEGRGPAWSNSLFEDNAEFGLGMRLALDQRQATARRLVGELGGTIGDDLVTALLGSEQSDDTGRAAQRARIAELRNRIADLDDPRAATLSALADDLVDTAVWIVGGDGWAYDIGFGGLDHVLASGHDVNVLVMDTEGYSNTGGQASKATFRSAVAKFASGGKEQRKKDLGMLAAGYGNVYVAQVAIGSNDLQTTRAIQEAQSYEGPSLVLAYSHCIAHGIDMSKGAEHQKMAVKSGYWPLWRYDPRHAHRGDHPLRLDSKAPSVPFAEFARSQTRFSLLERTNPPAAERLFALAQHDIDERWNLYEQMGEMERWADDEVTP